MIRAVQILCIVILVGVLFAFREAFMSMRYIFDGPGFPVGFMCGAGLFAVIWLINDKMDRSARARHSSPKQD